MRLKFREGRWVVIDKVGRVLFEADTYLEVKRWLDNQKTS